MCCIIKLSRICLQVFIYFAKNKNSSIFKSLLFSFYISCIGFHILNTMPCNMLIRVYSHLCYSVSIHFVHFDGRNSIVQFVKANLSQCDPSGFPAMNLIRIEYRYWIVVIVFDLWKPFVHCVCDNGFHKWEFIYQLLVAVLEVRDHMRDQP